MRYVQVRYQLPHPGMEPTQENLLIFDQAALKEAGNASRKSLYHSKQWPARFFFVYHDRMEIQDWANSLTPQFPYFVDLGANVC